MGVVTLSAGAATVLNTTITANTRIFLTNNDQDPLNLAGFVRVTGRTPRVSFSIASTNETDVYMIAWLLIAPPFFFEKLVGIFFNLLRFLVFVKYTGYIFFESSILFNTLF